MEYTALIFTLSRGEEYQKDLLVNALGEIGFDTFEDTDSGFDAYIPAAEFNEAEVNTLVQSFVVDGLSCSFSTRTIAQKNWNEVWESNFEPLLIGDSCYVRATFHEPHPEYPYEIVIDPKMAFGTGHHQTTSMMIDFLLQEELNGKIILDMGCGTGILAIFAIKAGASRATAIDNDPVCYESTIENAALNVVGDIHCLCGSVEAIPGEKFDIIAANINRNILLDQLPRYAEVLAPGGVLLLSGFYEHPDLELLTSKAAASGLHPGEIKRSGDWVAARFT